jgi:hypothetical protein
MGFVESVAMSGSDTVVTINIDPNLGYGELAPGIQLTFADDEPDTITAASGSPFTLLVDGDRVRVLDTEDNDDTYELDSASGVEIVLEATEAVTDEGPVDARIFQSYGIVPSGTNSIELHVGADQGDAAWRDVGLESGKLVDWDDLGDHAFEKDGEGNADTLDDLHAEEVIAEAAAVASRNLLVNGDFARWQEGESMTSATTPANDDGAYCCDQWALLSDGDDVAEVSRLTSDLPDNVLDGLTLEWATADEEAAIYQMVEQQECQSVLGGEGVASLIFRIQGGPAVGFPEKMRAAVLSWNGTKDGPTSDPIDDGGPGGGWIGAGYLPNWKSSFIVEGMIEIELTEDWQECVLEGVAIDAGSAKNIGLIIWSEDDTIAAGSKVNIARVRLIAGERAIDLEAEPTRQMRGRTDRYFCKTFDEGTPPEHGVETESALYGIANASNDVHAMFVFPERMFTIPGMTYYNPGNASPSGSEWWRDTAAGDDDVVRWDFVGDSHCYIDAGTPSAYGVCLIHATATARFF